MGKALAAVILAATTLLPFASADWGGQGAREPSTASDRTEGWMFSQPDISSDPQASMVYFNGFTGTEAGLLPTGVDPNLALVGSAFPSYPERAWALLGVWKDCNKDGYIGFGEQGLIEYRPELLLDRSVCPAQEIPQPIPEHWLPVHNDLQMVREFFPIGWVHRAQDGHFEDTDPWTIKDRSTRVWMDDGLPGDAPSATDCYLMAPRGTYHGMAPLIDHEDCYLHSLVAKSTSELASALPQFASAWATVRGQHNPYGEEGDPSVVSVWACSRPPVESVYAPVPLSVYDPLVPPSVRFTISPAGTLNDVLSGFDHCNRATRDDGGVHLEHTVAGAPYSLESDYNMDQLLVRHQTDFALVYDEPDRTGDPANEEALVQPWPSPYPIQGVVDSGPFWHSMNARATSRNPFVSRGALGAEPVQYSTYYAYVSPSTVSTYGLHMPRGTTYGKYGLEACGTNTMWYSHGWACDPHAWYPNNTSPLAHELGGRPDVPGDGVPIGPRPGDPYALRDIDCEDSSVAAARAIGVSWGLATNTRCV